MNPTPPSNNLETHPERYHLLVVDDEEATRCSLADILRLEGFTVYTAPDGEKAINQLKKKESIDQKASFEHATDTGVLGSSIDLVLLDLKMPGIDGLDVLKYITEHRPGGMPDSPEAIRPVVILLTAHGSLESAIEALRHGASDYLLKPSSPAQILSSVRRGLERLEQASQKRQLIEDLESSVRRLKEGDTAIESETAGRRGGGLGDGQSLLRPAGLANGEQIHSSGQLVVLTLGKGSQPDSHSEQRTDQADTKITIDLARREIRHGNTLVKLTPTEGRLMKVFLENPQRVFLHRELVWLAQGYETRDWEAPEVLRPLVSRLRRKLAHLPRGEDWIVSVRGTGYVFDIGAITNQS
ncbi:MAG TPA: response regulator transcription factor [Anaerolineales bacterium]|nr:response regulator transcription factor [Anaerolineales bacterium]